MPRFIEGLQRAVKAARTMASIIRDDQGCCARTLEAFAKTIQAEADREDTPTVGFIVCPCGRFHSRE